MTKYEAGFIARPNLEPEAIAKLVETMKEIFTSRNCNVLEVKEWGLKDLAYDIERCHKGYYVFLKVEATTEAVNEFERISRINDNVIRFIVVADGE